MDKDNKNNLYVFIDYSKDNCKYEMICLFNGENTWYKSNNLDKLISMIKHLNKDNNLIINDRTYGRLIENELIKENINYNTLKCNYVDLDQISFN